MSDQDSGTTGSAGTVSPHQLHMMKHAWGYDSKTPGYRDRYCAHLDDLDMLCLVKEGMFFGPKYVGEVGEGCGLFFLTDAGIAKLKEMKNEQKTKRKKGRQSGT